ncbi:hypothetical protein GGP41_001064 [Bipolaris sorokiniana]|uniref:Uncharacterized protein n=1 Tax=Cochliobolus sativus TaxID=45130 RepID=A0A8H5Z914_COCSA|nr:hypothetical protein GGP41_001064 [Bipolaris sorokiniana]
MALNTLTRTNTCQQRRSAMCSGYDLCDLFSLTPICAYTIYRELLATTSLSTLISATPTAALSVTPTEFVSTTTLVVSASSPTGVSTSRLEVMEATPNPEPERQNKAWIAGAVIGPRFTYGEVEEDLDGWTKLLSKWTERAIYHEKDTEGQLIELSSTRHPVELKVNGPQ